MLKRACKEYGTDLEFRPVGKPEYGSHIERLMGTIGDEIHLLPGSTFSNLEERGAYDSEKMASFTLEELEAYLARWINTVYHQRLHRGINRTPLALWEDGIRGTRTNPGVGLRPRITDEERLRIDFLPFMERTVQQRGVTIDNVTYYDDKLRPYVDRRDPENPKRKLALRFHRDPRDISVIYFMDPLTREYSAVPYRNTARPPVSIWELREARRLSLAMGRADVDEDALFKAYAHLMEKQEQAVRTTVKTRRDQTRRDHWRRGERPIPSDARPSGQAPDLRAKDEAPAAAPGFPNPVLPPFGEDDELENDE
jgi:putative transposase